jgi:hypothetical protein
VYHLGGGIGPGGAVAGGSRGAAAVGPYGAVAGGSRGRAAYRGGVAVAGAGGVAAARRGTYHVTGAALRTQGSYVRSGFRYYNAFTTGWYGRYPTAWRATRWAAAAAWVPATWVGLSGFCGYPSAPVYYDYGSTVVYDGDTVYVNGEEAPVYYDYGSTVVYDGDTVYVNGEEAGTAEQYAGQAARLAAEGRAARPSEKEEWQPLGVFAVVRDEERTSDKIFQLAVNKEGVIRGNYYDALADNALTVYGSVDKKTQRAAWYIGAKKEVVFEAGIANLTRDETTVLVHYGTGDTRQFTLVRVERPSEDRGAR